jgi:hypothetical protein
MKKVSLALIVIILAFALVAYKSGADNQGVKPATGRFDAQQVTPTPSDASGDETVVGPPPVATDQPYPAPEQDGYWSPIPTAAYPYPLPDVDVPDNCELFFWFLVCTP